MSFFPGNAVGYCFSWSWLNNFNVLPKTQQAKEFQRVLGPFPQHKGSAWLADPPPHILLAANLIYVLFSLFAGQRATHTLNWTDVKRSLWGYNRWLKTRGTNKVKDPSDLNKRTWVWTRHPWRTTTCTIQHLRAGSFTVITNARTWLPPTPAASRNPGNDSAKPGSCQVAWYPTDAHAIQGYAAMRSPRSSMATRRRSPRPKFHKQLIYQPSTKEKLPGSSKVVI